MLRISHRLARITMALAIAAMSAGECRSQSTSSSPPTWDAARAAMSRGDYATAESLYRNALRQDAASAELLTDLGVSLQMQGRTTEAIAAFNESLKKKYLASTYTLLAGQLCVSGDFTEAKPMLRKVAREEAGDSRMLAVVAPCFLDADEPIESIEAYSALSRDKSYPQDLALIRLAKSYLAASQFFVARLKAISPNSDYLRAIEEARTSGSARGAFPQAQRDSPNFRPERSFEGALAIWNKYPEDAALLYQLAVLSGEMSMRQVELCHQKYADSPYLTQLELEVLADQGKEDAAAQGFQELLRSHPELPDLRFELGMLYRKERDWDKALAIFRQELDANPQEERAAARVSEALDQLGRWQELCDFLAPRVHGDSPPLWASLDFANGLEQLEKNGEAIQVLVIALASNPSSKAVHWRLLHLYRLSGDTEKASAEAKWFKNQPG